MYTEHEAAAGHGRRGAEGTESGETGVGSRLRRGDKKKGKTSVLSWAINPPAHSPPHPLLGPPAAAASPPPPRAVRASRPPGRSRGQWPPCRGVWPRALQAARLSGGPGRGSSELTRQRRGERWKHKEKKVTLQLILKQKILL